MICASTLLTVRLPLSLYFSLEGHSSGYDERCGAYSNIGGNAKRSYDIEGASGNVGMVLMERNSICSLKGTEWNIPSVKLCRYKQESTKQQR